METQKILYTEDLIRIKNIKKKELEMLNFTLNELCKNVGLNKNTENKLKRNQSSKEKEIEEVDNKILESQEACGHLYILIGKKDGIYINECAFCGKTNNDISLSRVNALTYKRDKYSEGYNSKQREGRIREIRDKIVEYVKANSTLTEDEVVEKLNDDILANEEKNKIKEKTI